MIDGDELERSYKHHLSDYSEWEQRDHASDWVLVADNLGEALSIDETMLQEDLVTILSNKAGHCKQGTIVSIVRGTKAEDIIEVLMQIPEEERQKVKEVTMDLSSSMRAIIAAVFPNATIVLDCFHVLKRCHDAIEEVRLHLKRDAQVELRRQERAHRETQKRRAQQRKRYRKKHPRKPGVVMRGRPPKRKNERFKAPTYSNGDTKLEPLRDQSVRLRKAVTSGLTRPRNA